MPHFSKPSFYQGDRQTYRRVAVIGALFCVAFVLISFSLRSQIDEVRAAVKSDWLLHTAGQPQRAN